MADSLLGDLELKNDQKAAVFAIVGKKQDRLSIFMLAGFGKSP